MRLIHDGRQQLPSLDGPVDQQLGFLPARVHGLALQDHDNDEVPVLLEAAGQTGTRCFCDARLDTRKAVNAKQAVRVDPAVCVIVILVHRFKLLLLLLLRALIVVVIVV